MKRVAVVGAGTMGHGIAQVAAMAGFATRLTDVAQEPLESARGRIRSNLAGAVTRGKIGQEAADAALERITIVPDLSDAVRDADLVVEAIVEELRAKRELIKKLDELAAPTAILATNTSSLSVAKIAAAAGRSGRVLGMHFFNPAHVMRLVELIIHDGVDDDTLARCRDAVVRMGKEPIVVRDSPGFASSRLGVALGLEAMRMVEEGVADAADIDKAMELGYGHPMGPLRVSDLVGLDIRLRIADYLHRELKAPHFKPPEILRQKVRDGELGKKTGKGFYEWPKHKSS